MMMHDDVKKVSAIHFKPFATANSSTNCIDFMFLRTKMHCNLRFHGTISAPATINTNTENCSL